MLRLLFCVFVSIYAVSAEIAIPGNFDRFDGVRTFSHKIQNYLVSANRTISNGCQVQLDLYSQGLQRLERWALEMFDSSAKIPTGLLNGNGGEFGVFDQCLNIATVKGNQEIRGKYCLGVLLLTLPQTSPVLQSELNERSGLDGTRPTTYYAACLPNKCSPAEIQELYNSFSIPIAFTDTLCHDNTSTPEMETDAIVAITFFGIILGIMVASSIYDAVLHYTKKKPAHLLLTAFSVVTNLDKITQTSNNPNQLLCLHGIRALSLMWVIMGHRFTMFRRTAILNYALFEEWTRDMLNNFVMGATVSVDTFLMLGGFLITYTYMGSIARGAKFNILHYYLHRILRLVPPLAAIVLVTATLIEFLGSGPMWRAVVEGVEAPCKEYWWSTLLFVQNYVNPMELCLFQTWYLSADMQLFLLSPIILIPLKRKRKLALAMMGALTILSALCPFLVAWFYELRGFTLVDGVLLESEDYTTKFNYATHSRAAPWFIGLDLGYLMFQTKRNGIKKLTGNKYFKPLMLLCWCVTIGVMYGCVFGWHGLIVETGYDRFAHSAQIGFIRSAWAIAVGWVIFACVHGYGGPVNWFLSLGVFQFLSKLSYSMYLLHMMPIMIQTFGIKSPLYFGNFEGFYFYWADVIYTTMLGLIWVLAFESPIVVLEKVMFGGGRRPRPQKAENEKQNGHADVNDKAEKVGVDIGEKNQNQDADIEEKGAVDFEESPKKDVEQGKKDNISNP